jgi:hypothetical protein
VRLEPLGRSASLRLRLTGNTSDVPSIQPTVTGPSGGLRSRIKSDALSAIIMVEALRLGITENYGDSALN